MPEANLEERGNPSRIKLGWTNESDLIDNNSGCIAAGRKPPVPCAPHAGLGSSPPALHDSYLHAPIIAEENKPCNKYSVSLCDKQRDGLFAAIRDMWYSYDYAASEPLRSPARAY